MEKRPNNECTLQRRHVLTVVLGLPVAMSVPTRARGAALATPPQSLGPFYPRDADERPRETDADLLQVIDNRVLTRGTPLYLTGRVLTLAGAPIAGATIELWQCDANAVYHHPAGGAINQRDPGFQGYGQARSEADGAFHFRTIVPVPYPGRTPHIHVRIQTQGRSLATQLYLADAPQNARDFLYRHLTPAEQRALTLQMEPTPADAPHPLAQLTRQTARVRVLLA